MGATRRLAAAFVGGFGVTIIGINGWKQLSPEPSDGTAAKVVPPAIAAAIAANAAEPLKECKETPPPQPLVVEAPRADRMERWQERWATGNTRWHLTKPNPVLKRYDAELFGPPEEERGTMCVLFPLCGNSVDLAYLARRGHDVVGVDGVELALEVGSRDHDLLVFGAN